MQIHSTIEAMRAHSRAARRDRKLIGCVPTMGALHEGHLSLVRAAKSRCEFVVASIFVNPTQFGPNEDLAKYPRNFDRDRKLLENEGIDAIFAPDVAEMYPSGATTWVNVDGLSEKLDGKSRPGHFRGVATVVLKLLEIVQPDTAYFGEKDAQQLAIIRRLAADFNVPVAIVGVPTVREADGLAISSRNVHLSPDERRLAPALYRALCEARDRIAAGAADPAVAKTAALAHIPEDPGVRLEYLEIVNPGDMQPVERISGPVCVAGAMWVGATRLIDNVMYTP